MPCIFDGKTQSLSSIISWALELATFINLLHSYYTITNSAVIGGQKERRWWGENL